MREILVCLQLFLTALWRHVQQSVPELVVSARRPLDDSILVFLCGRFLCFLRLVGGGRFEGSHDYCRGRARVESWLL